MNYSNVLFNGLPKELVDKKRIRQNLASSTGSVFSIDVPHQATMKLRGRTIIGSSLFRYVFSRNKEKPWKGLGLTVNDQLSPIGWQSSDAINAIIRNLRPSSTAHYGNPNAMQFDMRALAYVCGDILGAHMMGEPCKVESVKSTPLRGVSPSMGPFEGTYLSVTRIAAVDDNELATLQRILYLCGCNYFILNEDNVAKFGRVFEGTTLAEYVARLSACVLAAADETGCGDHHVAALFRGMTNRVTLEGHTDEGGWLRALLRQADYPAPVGHLGPLSTAVCGLPVTHRLDSCSVDTWCINFYLSCVRCVSAADPCDRFGDMVLPTIMFREYETPGSRPSDWPRLSGATCSWWVDFVRTLGRAMRVSISSVIEHESLRTYFEENKTDRHLNGTTFIPFYWVDPTGLNSIDGVEDKFFNPGTFGKQVTVPLVGAKQYARMAAYREFEGVSAVGSRVRMELNNINARMMGIHYILNSAYRAENGLNMFSYICEPTKGYYLRTPSMCKFGESNLAAGRWVTPDSCAPNPHEHSVMGYSMLLEYENMGGSEALTFDELMNCEVSFSIGHMRLNAHYTKHPVACVRDCPQMLIDYMYARCYYGDVFMKADGYMDELKPANGSELPVETIPQPMVGSDIKREIPVEPATQLSEDNGVVAEIPIEKEAVQSLRPKIDFGENIGHVIEDIGNSPPLAVPGNAVEEA